MSYTRILKTLSLVASAAAMLVGSIPLSALAQLDSLPQYRYVRLKHADTTLYMYGDAAEVNENGVVLITNPFLLRGTATEQFQTPFLASVWVDGTLVPVSTGTDYEQTVEAHWNRHGQIVTSGFINYPERVHIHPLLTALGQTPAELDLLPKTHHGDPDFPYPPCLNAYATDINDNGVIIGHAREGINFYQGIERFLVTWNGGGAPVKLPAPDGISPADLDHHSQELYINNNGTIAGTRYIQSSLAIGFYGDAGSLASIPYGRDSLVQAHVLGLGENDWAIGTMQGKWQRASDGVWITQTHGWVSKDGQTMIDLNNSDTANQSPGVFPKDVNLHGLIVGSSGLSWNSSVGVLWREENGLFVGYGLEERIVEGNGDIPFSRISGAVSIADNGIILAYTLNGSGFAFPALLIPTDLDLDNGFCVNTDGDLPDANPGDGICSTGELNAIGVPYCSMRAAIEEANALAGVDTICFDIPLNRTIYPQTPLPAITDSVVIDGTTQPGGPPHLNGQQQGFGSGLEILAGGCTVLNLMLNSFPSDGLELRNGDGNTIENCRFGTDQSDTADFGNGGHGLYIENSSQNEIGRPGALERANTFAWNGQAGVFVQSGDQNTIFTNRFFSNDGLAIDLAPLGVNNNDDDDTDTGPNTLLNHPVIDSVSGGYLYGTINGEPNELMVVELYRSDEAHPTRYGEGREPLLLTTTVNTDANGDGTIELFLDGETLSEGQVYTLLAHDADNTSEFSPAWPNKRLLVTDHNGAAIPSMDFEMYRIDGGPPDFPETLIDTVMTDENGRIELTDYFENGDLDSGAVIKLSRFMASEPTMRPDSMVLPEAIEWYLDNADFDDDTFVMGYDTLDVSPEQEIRMDHTLVLFNLHVSMEWEFDQDYIDRLTLAFREGSNYLFDISDGQMALGKVHIVDDKYDWARADLRIVAQNNYRAGAEPNGVRKTGPWFMQIGRQWYGDDSFGPDSTYLNPLDPATEKNIRVIIHEIGHYYMGLDDEYEFFKGNRCSAGKLYGFMDHYYDVTRPETSEMSQASDYDDPACQNTWQWRAHQSDCWEAVDGIFTRTEANVELPIVTPVERFLPLEVDRFEGPNNNRAMLDYDIGARLEVTTQLLANSSTTHTMRFEDPTTGASLGVNQVTLIKPVKPAFKRRQHQGKTNSDGWINVLGAETGDSLELQGQYTRLIGGAPTAALAVNAYQWASVRTELNTATDSQIVTVPPVLGNYPLLCSAELGPDSAGLVLDALNMFSADPSLTVHTDSGSSTPTVMTATANAYSAALPDSLLGGGTLTVDAVDDTGGAFFFNIDYTHRDSSTGLGTSHLASSSGDFEAPLDSTQGAYDRAMVLSTDYPPLAGNLPVASRQVSRIHALTLLPNQPFADSLMVTISYDESAVGNDSGLYGNEVSVAVFQWNESAQDWEMLPSIIDTTVNIVMARIAGPGTFAAFTSDVNTDVIVIDDDLLPATWSLAQNYPNPFNPTTTIEYSIPTASHVELTIHNLLGQRVTTLVEETQAAGRYAVTWDGKNNTGSQVASGVYFYRIVADGFTSSRKMILLK